MIRLGCVERPVELTSLVDNCQQSHERDARSWNRELRPRGLTRPPLGMKDEISRGKAPPRFLEIARGTHPGTPRLHNLRSSRFSRLLEDTPLGSVSVQAVSGARVTDVS